MSAKRLSRSISSKITRPFAEITNLLRPLTHSERGISSDKARVVASERRKSADSFDASLSSAPALGITEFGRFAGESTSAEEAETKQTPSSSRSPVISPPRRLHAVGRSQSVEPEEWEELTPADLDLDLDGERFADESQELATPPKPHKDWIFNSPSLSSLRRRSNSPSFSPSPSRNPLADASPSPPSTPPKPTPTRAEGLFGSFRRMKAAPTLVETCPTPPSTAKLSRATPTTPNRRQTLISLADSPSSGEDDEEILALPLATPLMPVSAVQKGKQRESLPSPPSTSPPASPSTRRGSLPAASIITTHLLTPTRSISPSFTSSSNIPENRYFRPYSPFEDVRDLSWYQYAPLNESTTTLFTWDLHHLPAPDTPREAAYKVKTSNFFLPTAFLGGGRFSGQWGDVYGPIERNTERERKKARRSTWRESWGRSRGSKQGMRTKEELDEWCAIVVE